MGVTKEVLETFLPANAPGFTIENLLESHIIANMPNTSCGTKFVLTDDARALPIKLGDPLNAHIEWYGKARSAVDVSGDLRARILDLYDSYLAPDGKVVDYDSMQGDARFYAYVDATVELTKVDLTQLSRDGTFLLLLHTCCSKGAIVPQICVLASCTRTGGSASTEYRLKHCLMSRWCLLASAHLSTEAQPYDSEGTTKIGSQLYVIQLST